MISAPVRDTDHSPRQIIDGLETIRRRRRVMWRLQLALVAGVVGAAWLWPDGVGIVLALLGLGCLIAAGIVVSSLCPKCGEAFHYSRSWAVNPWTGHCLYCGLELDGRAL